jgi:hypothetical protein
MLNRLQLFVVRHYFPALLFLRHHRYFRNPDNMLRHRQNHQNQQRLKGLMLHYAHRQLP